MPTKQTNIVANKLRHLIFFEGQELCFNYKTGQWSEIPAYDGLGMFSVNSTDADIGLVRYSSGSVDLQVQATTDEAQTATLETASADLNEGGRSVITGVRPLINGGTTTVQVGIQDALNDAVSYSTATSLNSRTGMANFRDKSNIEGRYVRTKYSITGGFTTALGADIDFAPSGNV